MNNDMSDDFGISVSQSRYKVILIGDVSVGKTALVTQFIEGRFSMDYEVS